MSMAVRPMKSEVANPRVNLVDRFSVLLVAVAATLWASDTYFRAQLIGHLKPTQIVVLEDALVSLFLVVFLVRGIPEMRRLSWRGWLAMGLGGVRDHVDAGGQEPLAIEVDGVVRGPGRDLLIGSVLAGISP